jgi:hypothetical protein
MINNRQTSDSSRGMALDLWRPPEGAGQPLICLATTFAFDSVFFETECLGRFFSMDSDLQQDEAVGYLVEREEKLASAHVCVFVDRHHAQTRESLRWDILPVVVPGAIQNAKLAILCWAKHVRLIIGSGDLIEPAYCRSLEVFGTLDASRKNGGSITEILASIEFLEQMIRYSLGDDERQGPKQRVRETLNSLRKYIRGWPRPARPSMRVLPIFSGLGPSVFEELHDVWPSENQPRAVHIISPSFDSEGKETDTFFALLEIMAKRQTRFIYFYFKYEDLPEGKLRVFAPRSLVDAAKAACNVSIEKIAQEQDREIRPLHAKMLALTNDEWELWLIGSSNLTRAGFGMGDAAVNMEANLAYIVRVGEMEYGKLQDVWPEVVDKIDVKNNNIDWVPFLEDRVESQRAALLPIAFREALYDARRESPCLILSLGEDLPPSWRIRIDGEELLGSDSWHESAGDFVIIWEDRSVPLVLTVEWVDENGLHVAGWPINVVDPALLPPPAVLRDLSLDELIDIIGSTRPLHVAVIQVLKTKALHSVGTDHNSVARVNDGTSLLRRTKQVGIALERLRERLEQPIINTDTLEWQLCGPVGPLRLAEMFCKEAQSQGEARFLLAELALALKRFRVDKAAADGLPASVIRERVLGCITDIERMADSLSEGGKSPVDRYIAETFLEAKS